MLKVSATRRHQGKIQLLEVYHAHRPRFRNPSTNRHRRRVDWCRRGPQKSQQILLHRKLHDSSTLYTKANALKLCLHRCANDCKEDDNFNHRRKIGAAVQLDELIRQLSVGSHRLMSAVIGKTNCPMLPIRQLKKRQRQFILNG